MSAKIETTGQLRNFLVNLMSDVRCGNIDPDKASKITKIASQINENFYAEVKAAKCRLEMDGIRTELGKMRID